ncbi:hypothetical protein C8A01DRAFT_39116 [Parachaetomium inaequale]|uniref:Uncharacterized protein n=1 Tax=Parachaetomium inaequale TaxID=2588326 RepID=A0AAN6SN10_9PEZI|nr:hypothetical protein C8A01DRAFT_39116 [Parachaetomium inaequale]
MDQPRILLLSLRLESFFDTSYKPHLDRLAAKARVQHVKHATAIIRQLSSTQPPPAAVLVTDPALVEPQHDDVYDALLGYLHTFFAHAGLSWQAGSYLRTTFALNREAAVDAGLAAKLPPRYSQKALSVAKVKPEEAWYVTDRDSTLESLVWAPEAVNCPDEAPVAVGRVGSGRFAYIGDVNVEDETGDVIVGFSEGREPRIEGKAGLTACFGHRIRHWQCS